MSGNDDKPRVLFDIDQEKDGGLIEMGDAGQRTNTDIGRTVETHNNLIDPDISNNQLLGDNGRSDMPGADNEASNLNSSPQTLPKKFLS